MRLLEVLVIFGATLPAARIGVAAEKPATIDAVRNAWSKRQKSFRTVKLHWRREYTSVWRDPGRGARKPDGAPKPGDAYAYVQNAVVRFSGEKLDLRIRTKRAERFGATVLDRCAFDGTQSRALLILNSPFALTQGMLGMKKHEFGPGKAIFHPIAMIFRPLVPTITQFQVKNLRFEPGKAGEAIVDGHLCRMLTRSANDVIEYVYYGTVLPELHIAATLGILLAVSLTVGVIGEMLRLPKVTAYLAVGIAFGPSVLDLVPHAQVLQLNPLLKLAMGLVLFQLGNQFPLPRLKSLLKRMWPLSLGELSTTFALVTCCVWAFTSSLEFSLLLGALSLATAPATTLLVLQESESEGPVTDLAGGLLAVNNFCSIVAFELIFLALHVISGKLESSVTIEFLLLMRDIIGSLALGAVMGLAISYGCGLLKSGRWLVLLVAANAITLGLCETFQIPYMLAFFSMGLVVVNASGLSSEIQAELKHMTGLLTVTFFVIHGAELDVQALVNAGMVGVVYVVARSLGKCVGTSLGASFRGEPDDVRQWLGPSLLAQAGAAIALSAIAVERNPELGKQLQTVILGTVVVFELIGPILIRYSIRKAGEMPIENAIYHKSTTPWQQLKDVFSGLFGSSGRVMNGLLNQGETTVRQIMRPHVPPILESASFDEVLKFVENSHDDTYPVVSESGSLIGVIRYTELSHALFDPFANSLIRAADMCDPATVLLNPEDTVDDVHDAFRKTTDDCVPVIEPENGDKFVGVVRRRDVTRPLARQPVE
eukprot:g12596.t1